MENDTSVDSENIEKEVLFTFIEEINKLNIFSPTKVIDEVVANNFEIIDQREDIKNNLNSNLNCDLNFTLIETQEWNNDYTENKNNNNVKNQQIAIKSEESEVTECEEDMKMFKINENGNENQINEESDNNNVANLPDPNLVVEKAGNNSCTTNKESDNATHSDISRIISDQLTSLGAEHITVDFSNHLLSTSPLLHHTGNNLIIVGLPRVTKIAEEKNKEKQTIIEFLKGYSENVISSETTNNRLKQQQQLSLTATGSTTTVKKVLHNSDTSTSVKINLCKTGCQEKTTGNERVQLLISSREESESIQVEKSIKKEINSEINNSVSFSTSNLFTPSVVLEKNVSFNENTKSSPRKILNSEKSSTVEKQKRCVVHKEEINKSTNELRNLTGVETSRCHRNSGKSGDGSFKNVNSIISQNNSGSKNFVSKRKNFVGENVIEPKKIRKEENLKCYNSRIKIQKCVVRLEKLPFLDRLLYNKKIPLSWDPSFCDLCDPKRLFISKSALAEHINKEHFQNSSNSSSSDFSKLNVKNSNMRHSEETVLYNTRSRSYFDDNEILSLPQLVCEICNKTCFTNNGLSQHKKIHGLKKETRM